MVALFAGDVRDDGVDVSVAVDQAIRMDSTWQQPLMLDSAWQRQRYSATGGHYSNDSVPCCDDCSNNDDH